MIISLLLSSLLNTAQAVPLQITQQGRILDTNGAALSSTHDLTFRIYDSSSGGSVYWSETLTVNFTNGYYATVLGADEQNNPLDSSTLSLYPLFLELQVDNNSPMATRQAINSAPYAQISGNAEVAESVDGGSVNATEVSINSNQVIDGSGNWVGQPITVDWNNIDPNTIPSYIADGDDNTQLSEGQVENFITNGAIDLATNSQVGGSDIVTAGSFNSYLASDIADGDDDTLAGVSCSVGELISWSGAAWTCVSDNTLTVSDVSTMLANNAVDLNAATTIGGSPILTTVTDSDTLAALGCNDGEVAKYDTANGAWACAADIDTDTTLDQAGVLGFVTGQQVNLGAGSQVDGNNILTTADAVASDWNTLANRPSDLVDGDDDTLAGLGCSAGEIAGYDGAGWTCVSDNTLSVSDVTTMLANNAVDLNAGTTIGGAAILTTVTDSDTLAALGCADGEVAKYNSANGAWACGADIDTDTTLDEATVETYITNGGLDLHVDTTVGGANVVTSIDDSDTLANLSCANDGEIARYDLVLDEWYCAADIDTVLDENTVETYVTNGAIDLNAGTTIGGSAILTTITDSDTLAALGCSDGQVAKYNTTSSSWSCAADIDTDTNLDESTVETYVTNGAIDLNSSTTIGGNDIMTEPSGCTNGQIMVYNLSTASWACGADTDTTLNASEVQAMVEAVSGLALQANTTVGGSTVLTESSSIGPSQLDGSGGTSGQVLTTDGATVSWADASGGGGTLTSPATLGESDGGDSYNSFDTPMTVPDNNSVGVTSVRYISDTLTVDTLSIDLQLTHDDLGEVTVTLTSPSGTTLTIYDGGNPGETSFDDNIGWNVDFNSGNLYSFNGESTQGTWMLNVVDQTGGNTGTLDSWTMRFNETWTGEMFIGGDFTVQNTTEFRNDVTIVNSDIVFTDQNGVEDFRIGSSTGTMLYKMSAGCLHEKISGRSEPIDGLLTLSANCSTKWCNGNSIPQDFYYSCNGSCPTSTWQNPNYQPVTCNNIAVGTIILH